MYPRRVKRMVFVLDKAAEEKAMKCSDLQNCLKDLLCADRNGIDGRNTDCNSGKNKEKRQIKVSALKRNQTAQVRDVQEYFFDNISKKEPK